MAAARERDAARQATLFDVGRPAAQEPEPPWLGLRADVALNKPVRSEFSYAVPSELAGAVRPGVRVRVPFGRGREVGVVVALGEGPSPSGRPLRPIERVLDPEPIVDAHLLELTRWMARRYACAWGEGLAAVLPGALRHERESRKVTLVRAADGVGPRELEALLPRSPKQHRLLRALLDMAGPAPLREVLRRLNVGDAAARALVGKGLALLARVDADVDPAWSETVERARPEALSAEQEVAVAALSEALGSGRTFLLQGVTGSGKTEVYLRLIERALALGRGAIVIVPEIALTPQTVSWFRSRFGEVAVLHSRLTDAQRLDTWHRVRRGEARVVVGARSALFAPVAELGVVVVDEEHEPSFKQATTPRYHARDLAVERARLSGAVCVLGSATPALETWHRAKSGEYGWLRLAERVSGGKLPRVDVVDMRLEKGAPLFSRDLRSLMADTLARKEQVILFLNRRGFAPVLWCSECGETVRCADCDVSMTFHRRIGRLVCHACCEERDPPRACPSCTAGRVRMLGVGSERVEAELRRLFPAARARRMDSDTMQRREDYEDTLSAFGRGELDVLVGTQMIAKGLDFPRVTLVGIVSADVSLHLPDFRAAERTFQLIAQVAGRAGRGVLPGRIVVQTASPEHPAIRLAARHDFDAFARAEDVLRAELGYPPHGRLVRAVVEDSDDKRVEETATRAAELLRAALAGTSTSVLGPARAPLALLRGRHRWHVLVKAPVDAHADFERARDVLATLAEERARPRVTIDVDPTSML